MRRARIDRSTAETTISLELALDGNCYYSSAP